MRIFIGQASEIDVYNFGTSGLLENEGKYYSAVVEFGSNSGGIEDIMISDGCGRSIPISTTHVLQLCTALSECENIHTELTTAEELKEFAEDYDNVATVCENGHVHY